MTTRGSVLVVGGGVAGIQASLDLAESGFRAYLLESAPSIGGIMAMLDKTFPTNDCSMCILSPKLVEAGQHPNIDILSHADLEKIEGKAGDFKVTYTAKTRYVNPELCTGCGACSEVCVLSGRIPDEFNTGHSRRSAIYVPFAQAVPRLALVDPSECLRITKGKCKSPCLEACQRKAIDFDGKDESETVNVGAIVLASGSNAYEISKLVSYHPEHPNVISSLEMERIMCASGPTTGRITRPSDSSLAKKIAFIQCAGSRDEKHNPYCSGVCCTYAVKEATVIKEHDPEIDCHVFHIDMRTFGKGFDAFKTRAQEEYGIRFTHFKIPAVEVASPDTLRLRYLDGGGWKTEEYDLVVLSVGLSAPTSLEAALEAGVGADGYGFVETSTVSPLDTSVPGIFACGAVSGPKDIPESVAQASGAAARCGSLLSGARGTEVTRKEYPPEIELDGSEPRVGVFVCSCGNNIGGVVDVKSVADYAAGLPGVAYSEMNIYTCSSESCDRIRYAIKEHGLNRVVVAACTPRTHEPLFRETIREAGLNRYLFDLANIRDQCSWVHSGEPVKATEKAKGLVRMSVAKARLLEPLPTLPVKVNPSALVIGGGPAGMAAALELGRAGFKTHLVEKASKLGGGLRDIPVETGGEELKKVLEDLRVMVKELQDGDSVEVITDAKLIDFSGYIGNFKATVEAGGKPGSLEVGAVIVATGGVERRPSSYLYGRSERVVTQEEFEGLLAKGMQAKSVVMIQCVEAREGERDYCSRVCCIASLNNALATVAASPETEVYVLYRDLMAFGLYEELYRAAREAGVAFVRYEVDSKPEVTEEGGALTVKVKTPDLPLDFDIKADYLVLATGVDPDPDNTAISEMMKVPLESHGFFLEAHVKLRPVDFATAGVFLAGMAHYPKLIEEAISQGCAAAGRAATVLSKEYVMSEGAIARVNERFCRGCGECENTCEFSAVSVVEAGPGKLIAEVNNALCVGCGMCAVACWSNAITMENFTDKQIDAMIRAARSG